MANSSQTHVQLLISSNPVHVLLIVLRPPLSGDNTVSGFIADGAFRRLGDIFPRSEPFDTHDDNASWAPLTDNFPTRMTELELLQKYKREADGRYMKYDASGLH